MDITRKAYLHQVNPKRQGSKEFVSDPGNPEDILILLVVSQGQVATPTVPQQSNYLGSYRDSDGNVIVTSRHIPTSSFNISFCFCWSGFLKESFQMEATSLRSTSLSARPGMLDLNAYDRYYSSPCIVVQCYLEIS